MRLEGDYHLLSTSIRFGTEGYDTDVAYINGQEIVHVVGVESDGTIKNKCYGFMGEEDFPQSVRHQYKKIPNFENIIQAAIDGHKKLPHFHFISWDFTLDTECQPICIEYNIHTPGTLLYQLANGPLFGDFSDKVLSNLKKESLRSQIPANHKTTN